MKEVAVQFGEQNSLAGVLTLPDQATGFPVVVLTTVGFTTRFGPARVHTLLARRLAEIGVACLRYDLDSLGDSGSCYSHIPLKERTQVEVGHAMDFLQDKMGARQFMLAGICSGAEASFRCAAVDPRVVGAIMVDPFSIPTLEAKVRFFFYRVKRKLFLLLNLFESSPTASGDDVDLVNYHYMNRAEVQPILQQLLARKIYVHMVYTATVREELNHPGQLQTAFPELPIAGNLVLDWLPRVTHSPVFVEQVKALVETIAQRLEQYLRGVK